MRRNLNICLHNIVNDESDIVSIYDLTVAQLQELNNRIMSRQGRDYDSYTFYFDDGYKSFSSIVSRINLGVDKANIRCAIIVDQIGEPGKLTLDEIQALSADGYGIDSHGMSHAALATFEDGKLMPTVNDGNYRNRPYGQGAVLSEKEVLFQLIESKTNLENSLHGSVNDFVLPYGLYNDQVLQIILAKTTYKRILTCHPGIDTGQILAPRLLITQDVLGNIDQLLGEINDVTPLLTRH